MFMRGDRIVVISTGQSGTVTFGNQGRNIEYISVTIDGKYHTTGYLPSQLCKKGE